MMPSYTENWLAVWKPYADYGKSPGTDQSIREVTSQIESSGISQRLDALNPFFVLLEDYRKACADLRARPTSEPLAENEQKLNRQVVSQSRTFQDELRLASEACKAVIDDIQIARTAISNDKQHLNLIENVIKAVVGISNALTADMARYGKNIGQTLDQIRRSAA